MCLQVNILMATKTLTITEDAYDFLTGIKKESESFSNLFIRLAKEKSVAGKYFGILSGDIISIRKDMADIRKDISTDFKKRKNVSFRH